MPNTPRVGAFAIVPSNDLAAAILFWARLGFARTGGDDNYIILTGWGCEVHLTQAGVRPWRAGGRPDYPSRRHPAPPRMGSLRGGNMRTRRNARPHRLAFAADSPIRWVIQVTSRKFTASTMI